MKGNAMNDGRQILARFALAMADLAAIVALRPDEGLAGKVAAPHAWVAEAGADGAAITLAGAALWVVALWLGAGLLAAVATGLPGRCGQLARTLARVLLPAAVYRVVAGAAGLGVLLAPVAAGAAGASPSAPDTSSAATLTSTPPIPTPTWPGDPAPLPTPSWPTTVPGGHAQTGTVPRPDPRAPKSPRPALRSDDVLVRPGDSLWSIAAAQLGRDIVPAEIAVAWPHWYSANRAVIGADPDLIKPGQRLAPPASTGSPR
jgi:hypothetical protein